MSHDPTSVSESHRARRRRFSGLLGAILLVFAVQNLGAMRATTATSDETSHLPAGYTYVATGNFRLNPQHPPLVKILAGLPLLALEPRLNLADPGWTASPPEEWGFGFRFLYANDADRLLFWGRLPVVAVGLIGCLYVALWARALFGDAAGLGAATLFALCPTVIGHAHLVTMDVPLAAFATASLYHLRSFYAGGRRVHLAASGLALGAALASKFSAVVYLPAILALVAYAAFARPGRTRGNSSTSAIERLRRVAVPGGIVFGAALLVVWVVYLCPTDPLFYWKGLTLVNRDHDPTVPDYLLGEFRIGGWWYYFPVAFAMKTPLPTLGLVVAGLATWRRWRAPSPLDEAFLVLPAALFLIATCAFAANIGVRYLIPLYPPLLVSASRTVPALVRRGPGRILAAALAIWLAVGAVRIHPDGLAYFNEAVGGPTRGPELLDDSNVDWGGGLKRLADWMEGHGVASVRLLYPWNGSPAYYGIRSTPVTNEDWLVAPRPGVYAVSTMALVRGRLTARREGAHSDWLDRYEPSDRVGYGFYIYRFEPTDAPGPGDR